MAGKGKGGGRSVAPHEAQPLSTSRLFVIVVVFLVLAAYSIWNSDRFQSLFQGVSQTRLSELLQRPVSFRRVDFHVFPPSVRLADVRVGNDPRLPDEPLFSAEEVAVGGGISVTGGEIRLGRVRAIHPRLDLVQFPDGTWNLPPGLARPPGGTGGGGGLQLRVAELVVQQGTFQLDGRKMGIDGRLEGFAAELFSLPRGRYRGTVACRKATLALRGAEPLVFGLDLRFRLDANRGLDVEALRAVGEFGDLRGSATVDDLKKPTVLASISGDVHVAEVERIFHSGLGFGADAHVQARLQVRPTGGFRITGKLSAPHVDAKGFPIENLEASVVARPDALIARIERAGYAGGEASGVFRIENVGRPGSPRPMTLALEGKGLSIERFFGDIHLPGTGLSGAATLSAALRWGSGGLEHASGGATISIAPGPAASIVRGRFGIPFGGGGPLSIVDGRIGFASTRFRLAASDIEVTGGLHIGQWTPDFDVQIRSRDLAELDRVFQNFVAAAGDRPSPLGLGGTGEIEGHITKSWSNPDATLQVSGEDTRYSGVLFGSVRGAVDMHDGAFLFHPLRVYDGSAAVSLEGTVRYRKDPSRPRLDLTATAKDYPVARFLEYLDLDYPITGRVTGSFPLVGSPPDGVSGGGEIILEDAVVWGQEVSRIAGRLVLEPRVLRFEDVRANLGPGMLGGHAVLAYRDRTFELRVAGDGIRLSDIEAVRDVSKDISARLSFELEGSGPFDRPDFTASASLSKAAFFGHEIPAALEPRLAVRVVRGQLDGSVGVAGHWSVAVRGGVAELPARLDVAIEARDLPALLLLTPAELPPGDGASIAARGSVTIPGAAGEAPSGEFVVAAARLDASGHRAEVRTDGEVRVSFRGARVAFSEMHVLGEGVDLRARGEIDASAGKRTLEARLSGTADASILRLAVPDADVEGRIAVDIAAGGTFDDPQWNGTVRIEDGRYRFAGFSLENVDGGVRLAGSRGDIEGLRARVGDARGPPVEGLPPLDPGPPRRPSDDPGDAADRRRRSRGHGRRRRQSGAGIDHAAPGHVFEGRRRHDLGSARAQPADRDRRARALEGADHSRRPHRLGGLSGGPQQSGPALGNRRPHGARHPGRPDPARPGPARRRRAFRLQRRPLRDRVGDDHLRQHDADRALHRPARSGGGQGIQPGGPAGGRLAADLGHLHVGSAAVQRLDSGAGADRRPAGHPRGSGHLEPARLGSRRRPGRSRHGRPPEEDAAALRPRSLPDRAGFHLRPVDHGPLHDRQAHHPGPDRDLLDRPRLEQGAHHSRRVAGDQQHPRAPDSRRKRNRRDQLPPAPAPLMRQALARTALAVLLLAAVRTASGARELDESLFGRPVASVGFTSNGPVDAKEIAGLVAIRPGRPLTEEETGSTIRNLFGTARFSNILVEAEPAGGGEVAVTVHLWLAFRIRSISFEGKSGLSREDLRRAVPLSEGDPFNARSLAEGASAIERRMLSEGYLHASVDPDVTFDRTEFATDIVYRITSGEAALAAAPFFDGSIEPFTASELLAETKLKPGKRYREEKARDDAERIRKFLLKQSRLKASVDLIAAEATDDGRLRPVFRISVGPRFEFDVTGIKEKRARKEILALVEGQSFDDDVLASWVDTTRQALQRQGHYRARVEAEAPRNADPVVVRITVEPGPKYAVEKIVFRGNQSVSTDTLEALMVTRAKGLPFLQKGRLIDTVLDEDVSAILGYYQTRGWIDARVPRPEIVEGSEPDLLDLTVRIEEGPRAFVANRKVEGADHLVASDLDRLLSVSVGQPFNPTAVRQDVASLTSYYRNDGWREATVQNHWTLSDDHTKVDVEYSVQEGERSFFGKTIVRGNAVTRLPRIDRQVAWKEGDPYSDEKIAQTQRNLARTGVFRSIQVRPQPVPSQGDTINMDVDLSEARRLSLLYGVGYQYSPGATDPNDPFAIAGVTYRNLFGRMQSTSFEVQYAPVSRRGYAIANFTEPYLFNTDVPLTVATFASRQPIQDVDINRLGTFLESVRLFGHLRVGLRYSYQYIAPTNPQDLSTIILEKYPLSARPIKQSAIGPNLFYDRRDDVLDPHKGYYLSVTGGYAFPFLSADAWYGKVSGQAAHFWSVLGGVLGASFRAGAIYPHAVTSEGDTVPIAEKFFAGGSSTARGFDTNLEGIPAVTQPTGETLPGGTVDYNTQATPPANGPGTGTCAATYAFANAENYDCSPGPRIIGGNAFMAIGVEYRYPILGNLGVSVFYDLAQVWSKPGDMNFRIDMSSTASGDAGTGLRQSIGFGIHYMTPIGPLRFEAGWPLPAQTVDFAVTPTEDPSGEPCQSSVQEGCKPLAFGSVKQTSRIFLSIGYPF
jgi:outer membrane protein insertion porin family